MGWRPMLRLQENPRLPGMLEKQLTNAVESAALEAAIGLRGRLSYYSSRRTGKKYARYPRRSSRKGEYPQQQTGDLRDSVDAAPGGKLVALVGFNTDNREKVFFLERTGNSRGRGVRRPLFLYFQGIDKAKTLARMASAMRSALK